MKIVKVNEALIPDFKAFCMRHRDHVDDSFLTDDDLNAFILNDENPSILGYHEDGTVMAAASLIFDIPNRKARFRIFQSEVNEFEIYEELLKFISEQARQIDTFTIYGDEPRKGFFEILEKLGFNLERYIYVMERVNDGTEISVTLPEHYSIQTMQFDRDEEEYVQIRNTAFSSLIGSSPMSIDQVRDMKNWFEHWENGILFLKHHDEKIGLIRMSLHPDGDGFTSAVEPIAILPEYHRKGLGRQLLRAGLKFAQQNGVPKCTLCVNATNEQAADLYKKEGFYSVNVVLCWNFFNNK